MKQFFKSNWYKLMIGSSMFIFSIGFFINSISSVYAGRTDSTSVKSEKAKTLGTYYFSVIGTDNAIYTVENSDYAWSSGWRINKIWPK